MTGYQLYGGPLNGNIVTINPDDGPYFIFPVEHAPDLLVCYKIEDDKLIYVSIKTKQQLMDENS